jgi:hypothetical protein
MSMDEKFKIFFSVDYILLSENKYVYLLCIYCIFARVQCKKYIDIFKKNYLFLSCACVCVVNILTHTESKNYNHCEVAVHHSGIKSAI